MYNNVTTPQLGSDVNNGIFPCRRTIAYDTNDDCSSGGPNKQPTCCSPTVIASNMVANVGCNNYKQQAAAAETLLQSNITRFLLQSPPSSDDGDCVNYGNMSSSSMVVAFSVDNTHMVQWLEHRRGETTAPSPAVASILLRDVMILGPRVIEDGYQRIHPLLTVRNFHETEQFMSWLFPRSQRPRLYFIHV